MTGSTIVALSSGSLPSGVAVLRLSGPESFPVVKSLSGPLPPPRRMALRALRDPATGLVLDRALVVLFPAPASFTGEDCAELHIHGSSATLKAILKALRPHSSVHLAGPGDFTRRAFENGKLDLTEVEGLSDLLASETETQRRQALARFDGHLSTKLQSWRDTLLDLRAEIEARLDFSDQDDVPPALGEEFSSTLSTLYDDIAGALSTFERGRLQREGFRIVLAGPPNAGKSSLLNALSGSDHAIVTSEPGTTRDLQHISMDIAGHLVLLTDTAGLRETESLAERAGVERAEKAMRDADLVLWLSAPDAAAPLPTLPTPIWSIASKSDLRSSAPNSKFQISTLTGAGLDALLSGLQEHIEAATGAGEPMLVSHERDRHALEASLSALDDAGATLDRLDLCAESLRLAADSLARLLGVIDVEDVLDRLFLSFCIGK